MDRDADDADDAGSVVSWKSDASWSWGAEPWGGWRKGYWSPAWAGSVSWGSGCSAWKENKGKAQEKLNAPEFDGKGGDSDRAEGTRNYLRKVEA